MSSTRLRLRRERLVQDRKGAAPLYLQLLLMDVHTHHRLKPEDIDPDLQPFPDSAYLQAVRNATRPSAAFIKQLDALLEGRVILIVTADHGEGLNDHPNVDASRGHGNILYRSQVHVPLILIPGSKMTRHPSRRVVGVTELVDIVPTVLDLVGVSMQDELPGTPRVPAMRGDAAMPHRVAFTETQWRPGVRKVAAIDGQWLYVENSDEWPGTAPRELHPFHGPQNGAATNDIEAQTEAATRIKDALDEYLRLKNDNRPTVPYSHSPAALQNFPADIFRDLLGLALGEVLVDLPYYSAHLDVLELRSHGSSHFRAGYEDQLYRAVSR